MGYAYGSIDDFGSGVFRKVRRELGVTAFGVNAMVLSPGTGWFEHFHDEQDELYFVHRGRAAFDVEGERFELGPGGVVPRRVHDPSQVLESRRGDARPHGRRRQGRLHRP